MSDKPMRDLRGMAREMAKRSIVTEATARLLEQVLVEASDYHEARIAALEAALAPFADAADRYDPVPGGTVGDSVQLWQDGRRIDFINVGHLRAARKLLK